MLKDLRDIWTGFQGARVLMTANNLGVFEYLRIPSTAQDIAKSINCNERATTILLDALVGLNLLIKKANKYSNKPISNKYLLKESPYYQGDIIRHSDTMWHNWSGLDEVIKNGKPYRAKKNWDAFIKGMHNISILKSKKIIDAIGLKGIKTAIDIGGGPGTYCIELAKRGIEVTLFDFEETLSIAKNIAQSYGLHNKIKFQSGDIIKNSLDGQYDLVFISQLFHAYSEEENMIILKKAKDSLSKKGIVVIQEFFIDESRTSPMESALFSINMLVQTDFGRCYSVKEMKTWLKAVGLKNISEKRPVETILLIAKN